MSGQKQQTQKTLRHDQIEKEHRIEIPIPKRSEFFRNLKKAAKKSAPESDAPRVKPKD